ncbi:MULTISPECIES: sigma-70 family RNA polymerase sigma factor [Uliginosibacterium]|uniref:Sigma-70 family RNA polymerase sigma factor n=1 Tax=Uliginosibacterium aquaticum TaxID=2731212 RepID=A0ABX2IJY8_9RHOO|nr:MULTISPECIES: sigma-70 family RNA polymerase sigma factor [Uliginosibacterium]MDO6388303.1 sigma-70 family RNA polymerase sigma factor [Uliginosibacterium sp. 31-12]NSL56617.1 sigma-70 family RNA polymerase sigma factor [Uliginosibacterium aquaticum]PLK47388.1 RNA polymerase subunit sigma-70 [Uliginosibacterium sp. TH139]
MSTAAPADLAALPDEDLMLLVASGIIEAPATELFRRHNRALFNFIAWQCQGNLAEAEDIAQRSWEKLMTRCADYRPQAAFRTFLFQIARNLWLDLRRSAGESLREELDEQQPDIPADYLDPEAELALHQDLGRVHEALLALPANQREVVVLRFFAEMSLEEVAHTVGEGFETVKSRLRYAFARLRRELEGAT